MRKIIHFILIIIGFWAFSTNLIAQQLTHKQNLRQKSSFTENKGQITDQYGKVQKDVKYIYSAPGLKLVLKSNSLSYEIFTVEKNKNQNQNTENFSEATGLHFDFPGKNIEQEEVKIKNHRIDISFVGANQNPQIITEEKTGDYTNYYLAHTPEEGVTKVNSYNKVTYKNLYPNIDLIFYAKEEVKLKYDIIVHPGGKLEDVKMKYDGADGLALVDGKLKVLTSQGLLEEEIPLSYYEENKKEVKVKHLLKNNLVSFDVRYDNSKTLVIDPTLIWATFYGGMFEELSHGLCTDKDGNVFLYGLTKSFDNIATSGAHLDTNFNYFTHGFLVKLNTNGVRQWATYYGKIDINAYLSNSISTDAAGDIYIVGQATNDSSFTTTGAHQVNYGGGSSDAFLAKFNTNGIRQWGTFYGGSEAESGVGIAIDGSNNVYIIGNTGSHSGIASPFAHQTFIRYTTIFSIFDAFIAKFNSNGVRQWGTYYGDTEIDRGIGITTDKTGNVIISGYTNSTSGMASSGAHQTNHGGGVDAFIAKFNTNGVFQWGTYIGGNDWEMASSVKTDAEGNIYCTGLTRSNNGIASANAHQSSFQISTGITSDIFLAKFNSNGIRQWSTYYGGNRIENPSYGIGIDDSGNVFIAGSTVSPNGIATKGVHQESINGNISSDNFIAKFSKKGIRQWGTYFGGPGEDIHTVICLDNKGNIYISGHTKSDTNFATPGAHQTKHGDADYYDAYIAKFVDHPCKLPGEIIGTSVVCNSEVTSFKARKDTGVNYIWYVSHGTILSGQGTDSISVILTRNSFITISLVVTSGDFCKDSITYLTWVNTLPIFFTGTSRIICPGDKVSLGAAQIPNWDYTWKSNPPGFSSQASNPDVLPKISTTYYLTVTNKLTGCKKTDSVTITVNTFSGIDSVNRNLISCAGDTIKIGSEAKTGNTYSWKSNPPGFTSTISNPKVSPLAYTTYYLIETNTVLGCNRTDSVFVKVNPLPEVFAGNDTSICPGKTIKIGNEAISGHSYNWRSEPAGFSSTNANPEVSPIINTTYFLTETIDSTGCSKTDSVTVAINPLPEPELSGDSAVCVNSVTAYSANDTLVNAQYSWEITNGNIITGQTSKTINVQWQNADPGIVKLTVTNSTGCIATTEKIVKINALPSLNLGADTTICPGAKVTFDAGAGFVNYLWQNGSNQQTLEANSEGIYWVEVIDSNGCNARDSIKLSIFNIPEKILGNDTVVCRGVPVILNAGKDYAAYLWQNGETDQVFIASEPGIYWVEVTTANSCKVRDSINITLAPYPHIDLGKDTVICGGNGITYDAGEGYDTYLWSTGSRERILTVEKPGIYWAKIGNAEGCTASDTINIEWKKSLDIHIPNAFTPNDDGLNELYNAVGMEETQLFDLKIYSRWGELIFHSTDPAKSWDGKYRGKTAAEGVYLYIITTQDCQLNTAYKKGTIHLLR